MKIAITHEWFVTHAGSEKVVEQMLAVYPEADLFSLVDFLAADHRDFIHQKSVQTSFIQQLPFAKTHFRQYLPLMPMAVEQFDMSAYEVIISSSHAVAKGIISNPDQLHISYVHTPMRYAWDLQHQYLSQAGLTHGFKGGLTRLILHYLRLWDQLSANRVDHFVANSHYIARRIQKCYRRSAQVIYPPVDIHRFRPQSDREPFYLSVARFVPYKRVDLIVQAFNQLGLPLVVIGDGPMGEQIRAIARPNIKLLGKQSDAIVEDYMQRCQAFVFAAQEDFGITVVEAQAAGAPVIAFARGGATETVIEGKTGVFFIEQTVTALVDAVQRFQKTLGNFSPELSRHQAEQFSIERFRKEFETFTDQAWLSFSQGNDIEY
ncbi:MAG: glycosyltransferase family 4 protein [Cyanobacteria bacterium P01_A01_bin.123]